jgi:hypothetical protein
LIKEVSPISVVVVVGSTLVVGARVVVEVVVVDVDVVVVSTVSGVLEQAERIRPSATNHEIVVRIGAMVSGSRF